MHNNRLLVAALVLIAFGMAGIFMTRWFRGPNVVGSGMSSGGGMMQMMGGGMMNQDKMKEMMQEMMSGRLRRASRRKIFPSRTVLEPNC